MNILFVSEYFPPRTIGGGELSCFLLARALVQQGIAVTVLTSYFDEQHREEYIDGVRILRFVHTGYSPASFLSNIQRELVFPGSLHGALKQLLDNETFDCIHYFNTTSILGKLASTETSVPQLMHVNSPVVFCPLGTLMYPSDEAYHQRKQFWSFVRSFVRADEFGKLKNRWYYRCNPLLMFYLFYSFKRRNRPLHDFDYYTAVSSFMKQLLLEEGIDTTQITVIPNIVSVGRAQKSLLSKKRKKSILYLGLFMKNKGVYVLLDALKQLALHYTCHFYGDGPEKQGIVAYSAEHKLNVIVHGPVPHDIVASVLTQHDVVVFPSLIPESFGRIVVEAQAVGTVAVASKIGGTQYLVQHKKTGYLVTPGNASELAATLNYVLRTPQYNVITEGKRAARAYTPESVAKKMIEVYRSVLV